MSMWVEEATVIDAEGNQVEFEYSEDIDGHCLKLIDFLDDYETIRVKRVDQESDENLQRFICNYKELDYGLLTPMTWLIDDLRDYPFTQEEIDYLGQCNYELITNAIATGAKYLTLWCDL